MAVIDVNEPEFQQEVLEASYQKPVVVDFWAAWCGPCRILGPTLEKLAAQANGKWRLVKVDVDRNQPLAARYGVQGIPAVKAFRDGQVANEFVGALPEPRVRDWLRQVVPSKADGKVRQAETLPPEEAFPVLEDILAQEPDHAGALVGLARLWLAAGKPQKALDLLRRVPPGAGESARAVALEELARLMEEPDGDLRGAVTAILEGRFETGLDDLLAMVRSGEERERARRSMLVAFRLLGPEDPLTRRYQDRLAGALFG